MSADLRTPSSRMTAHELMMRSIFFGLVLLMIGGFWIFIKAWWGNIS